MSLPSSRRAYSVNTTGAGEGNVIGAAFGKTGIDIFNNAGVQGELLPLQDYPVDDFPFVMHVNVFGIFNVLRESAQRLRDSGRGGAIVNSASMAGVEGAANMPAYSASKGAVMSLTRSASKDLAPLGIHAGHDLAAVEAAVHGRHADREPLPQA